MKIPVTAGESWRPVPGYPGYEASSLGRIRSFRSRNGRGQLVKQPHLLRQSPMLGKPYHQVTLSIDGSRKQMRVHLLVALAFHGSRPGTDYVVCHSDGNPANNQASNIRWDTPKGNSADQVVHGTRPCGSKSHLAKLTDAQVLEVKNALPGWSRGMGLHFAKKFGVAPSAISNIKNNLRWAHL